MKWVLFIFAALLAIAVATGYTGGAKDAAGNYNKVMTGK